MRRKCEEEVAEEEEATEEEEDERSFPQRLTSTTERSASTPPASATATPCPSTARLPSPPSIGEASCSGKTVTGFWNVPTRELDGRGVGAPSKRCAPPPPPSYPERPAGSLRRDMRGSPVRAVSRAAVGMKHDAHLISYETAKIRKIDRSEFATRQPFGQTPKKTPVTSSSSTAGVRGAPLLRVARRVSTTSEGRRSVPRRDTVARPAVGEDPRGLPQLLRLLAAGSLRTRTEIGACLPFRVNAHTYARTRFIDSTSFEC